MVCMFHSNNKKKNYDRSNISPRGEATTWFNLVYGITTELESDCI